MKIWAINYEKIFNYFINFNLNFIYSIIKNSTKKIEDEIFTVKESLIGLKKELGDTKLEFNYLSSAEKLLDYQSMYFEEELFQKDIKKIQILLKNQKN